VTHPGARRLPPEQVALYVILDRAVAGTRDLEDILTAVIDGGARIVQLREKTWPSGRLLPVAKRLCGRARAAGVTFIVNDRVDLAQAIGADGVHVGQDDLPVSVARSLVGPDMLIGVSTHSVSQARAAQADGADYVAVGSMYPTTTKSDFELVGPELVRNVRPHVRVPLVGIGGVTPDNVGDVIRAGADGVAVISAVCAAADPAAATRRFIEAIRDARRTVGQPCRP
jgi:thiamine-phosphate diphosphorylase